MLKTKFHSFERTDKVKCAQLFYRKKSKLERMQDIRDTTKEKLYQQQGLESLEIRGWFRKLCFFLEFAKLNFPVIYNIIPQEISTYITKNMDIQFFF